MAKKFDNLSALDWDDSALIKAYEEGMALRAKNSDGTKNSKEEKRNSKKRHEWKEGDFCRAVYDGDDLTYEAKIISISGDTCIIEFLGYDEEMDVELDALSKSHGKKARKKQLKSVYLSNNSISGSASADDTRNNHSASESPLPNHYRKKHHRHHKGYSFNQTADYTANDSAFLNGHHVVNYNEIPSTSMIPPAPPMPQCSEVAKNPSLCAMLTSWYMAGYYTGLHQAQRNQGQRCNQGQHYCCQPTQNYYH